MKINAKLKCSTSLAVIDRRTETVVKSLPFPDVYNPDILPPRQTVVWHYVRFDYFQALLKNRAIHFSRLDKQSDKTDGTYSDANASLLTPATEKLMSSFGVGEKRNWADFNYTNNVLRKRAYVHCWTMRSRESAWMWNAFVSSERSVAIKSTIAALQVALAGQPVDFSRIIYYPPGIPRPDWSYTAPFSAKDIVKHKEERELRIMFITGLEEPDEGEYKIIPVDPQKLIGQVVVHPLSTREFQNEVRVELTRNSVSAHVARSVLRQADLDAVARVQDAVLG